MGCVVGRDSNLPQDAVKRYVRYWRKRVEAFGAEKAYLPMTLNGALRDDKDALALGVTCLLGTKDIEGRNIVFTEAGNMDITKATYPGHLRVAWYMFHTALDDEDTQKKGIIQIINVEHAKLSELDLTQSKRNLSNLAGTMPVRIGGVHVCKPPFFSNMFKPILILFLHEEVRSRLHFHVGKRERVVRGFEKLGISRDKLPSEIGGSLDFDRNAWLEHRRAVGL